MATSTGNDHNQRLGTARTARSSRSAGHNGTGGNGKLEHPLFEGNGRAGTEVLDVEPLERLLPAASGSPVLWGMHGRVGRDVVRLARSLSHLPRRPQRRELSWESVIQQAIGWLDDEDSSRLDATLAALALAHALGRIKSRVSGTTLERLVRALRSISGPAPKPQGLPESGMSGWRQQVLHGELPLVLIRFGAADPSWASPACQVISGGLVEYLDGDGQIHGSLADWFRPLFATWTRALRLREQIDVGRVTREAMLHYSWLVQQSLRWCGADGTAPFAPQDGGWSELLEVCRSAPKTAVDEDDAYLIRQIFQKKTPNPDRTALPGTQSDWTETAVLRTGWGPDAACLAVRYGGSDMEWELSTCGRKLWAGVATPRVVADGKSLRPVGTWEAICWESDDDIDYLELAVQLDGGWRLERQCAVVRRDQFLLLGDVLLGSGIAELSYELELPLAAGVEVRELDETTEVILKSGRFTGRMVPLAFPEWKQQCRGQSFSADVATWHTQLRTPRFYFPLILDLDPGRKSKPLTWRRLTVGENLRIVSSDVAAGYRVQIGKQQWLIYRALGPKENRTLLGQNLVTEFFLGRFLASGATETLVEIE